MSTPPPNYPPPGQGYYAAPPPPQNSGNGCLKAAGITCGVLVLLAVIFFAWIFYVVKSQVHNPHSAFGQIMGQGMQQATEQQNGLKIQQAVAAYKVKTGTYPSNLKSLVPFYLSDGSILHSSFDPNVDPSHVSWTYTKPGPDTPPDAPMLKLPVAISITFGGQTQTTKSNIVINVNGSISQETTEQTPGSAYGHT